MVSDSSTSITRKRAATSNSRFAYKKLQFTRTHGEHTSMHISREPSVRSLCTSKAVIPRGRAIRVLCADPAAAQHMQCILLLYVGSGPTRCSSLRAAVLCAAALFSFCGVSSDHSTRGTRSATRAPATSRALASRQQHRHPPSVTQADYLKSVHPWASQSH